MKICQLCAVDFTLNHFLLPLIDRMQNEGWEVESVCSKGPYVQKLREDGYKIINVAIPRKLNLILILLAIYKLYKLFKVQKYDIVHVHTPIASIIGRVACKLSGVKMVVYTAHGFYFHERMRFFQFYFFVILEKFFGFITDILFTQSNEDKLYAIKAKILPKEKIFYIGNGINIKRFNPEKHKKNSLLKKKLNIPLDCFVIGVISRLVEEKGLVEFLDAAERISENFLKVYFVVIGERLASDHNTNIDTKIFKSKKKIGDRIKFLGYRKDIPELLSILDLFCSPSWREGMPRSIIEAMMMEKPVLATNIRGSRELIVNQQTGVLVPVASCISLEKGMIEFINNNKKCRQFGKDGRKRALKLYDENKIVDLQIKIIKKHIRKNLF